MQHVFRPVEAGDLADILDLARESGSGLTTLMSDEQQLAKAIARSEQSFACTTKHCPGDQNYWFVLEDCTSGKVVGSAAIEANTGHHLPFYTYRLTHASKICHGLGLRVEHRMLMLNNDLQGCSELATLYLRPPHRRNQLGQLLSRARLMFMAMQPQRFNPTVIAEIRGVVDDKGRSPFWQAVGSHFFQCTFAEADRQSTTSNKQFIADLMPDYPVYMDLLPTPVQQIIGQAHSASIPAMKMLEREGMVYDRVVDIFDAGPAITAQVGHLKTVQATKPQIIAKVGACGDETLPMLLSNHRLDYRACLAAVSYLDEQGLVIDPFTAQALAVDMGDRVQCCPLSMTPFI